MRTNIGVAALAVCCLAHGAFAEESTRAPEPPLPSKAALEARVADLGHYIRPNGDRHETALTDCMFHAELWNGPDSPNDGPLWTIFDIDIRGLDIPAPDKKTGLRVMWVPEMKPPLVLAVIKAKDPFYIRHEKAKSRASNRDDRRIEPAPSRDGVEYVYDFHQNGFILFEGDTNPQRFDEIFRIILDYRERFCLNVS